MGRTCVRNTRYIKYSAHTVGRFGIPDGIDDGCYNHVPDVARKFGFEKQEDNSSGIFKCYNWSDIDNIACEVEEIIISLLGETIANSFVSDEVFIAIMEKQQAQLNSQAKAQRIKYNVLGMLIAVVIMVITFAVLLLFT